MRKALGLNLASVRRGVWLGTAIGLGWTMGEWMAELWRYRGVWL